MGILFDLIEFLAFGAEFRIGSEGYGFLLANRNDFFAALYDISKVLMAWLKDPAVSYFFDEVFAFV